MRNSIISFSTNLVNTMSLCWEETVLMIQTSSVSLWSSVLTRWLHKAKPQPTHRDKNT